MCGLTFELSWGRRWDARARLARMYKVLPTWPAWPAVGAQLERGVRRHSHSLLKVATTMRANTAPVKLKQQHTGRSANGSDKAERQPLLRAKEQRAKHSLARWGRPAMRAECESGDDAGGA
jgi:hypothetical protein